MNQHFSAMDGDRLAKRPASSVSCSDDCARATAPRSDPFRRPRAQARFRTTMAPNYLSGFGNEHASEALPGGSSIGWLFKRVG